MLITSSLTLPYEQNYCLQTQWILKHRDVVNSSAQPDDVVGILWCCCIQYANAANLYLWVTEQCARCSTKACISLYMKPSILFSIFYIMLFQASGFWNDFKLKFIYIICNTLSTTSPDIPVLRWINGFGQSCKYFSFCRSFIIFLYFPPSHFFALGHFEFFPLFWKRSANNGVNIFFPSFRGLIYIFSHCTFHIKILYLIN